MLEFRLFTCSVLILMDSRAVIIMDGKTLVGNDEHKENGLIDNVEEKDILFSLLKVSL